MGTHTASHSMGSSSSTPTIPERTAVPTGVTRIHVIGMRGPFGGMGSPNVGKAHRVAEHHSMPFVWLERSDAEGNKVLTAIGGRDKFDEWARKEFENVAEIAGEAQEGFSPSKDV